MRLAVLWGGGGCEGGGEICSLCARDLMCLEQVGTKNNNKTWCVITVLRLNVPSILSRFFKVTLLDAVTDSCLMGRSQRSSPPPPPPPPPSFWRHQNVFWCHRKELSVGHGVKEALYVDCSHRMFRSLIPKIRMLCCVKLNKRSV